MVFKRTKKEYNKEKMSEFGTMALVLDKEPIREFDSEIHLFTEKLGRVTAKAIGARKILSKLSAHLEPNSVSFIRLVEKKGFLVADAIKEKRLNFSFEELLVLKNGTAEFEKDQFLWERINEGKFSVKEMLKHFGFNPKFSSCSFCGEGKPEFFYLKRHEYVCERCVFNLGMEGEEMVNIKN